jgi:hypothetical protein
MYSNVPDCLPRDDGQDVSRQASALESFRTALANIEEGMEPWLAHACLDPDPSEVSQDSSVVQQIRSLAARVAMHGIAIVARSAWTVGASERCSVHAASFRPTIVSRDWFADAMLPAICRVYLQSLPLQLCLDVLWVAGATCGFVLLCDNFESGSAQEGLACSSVALTLPSALCTAASFNAKTVRLLLKEFETLYLLAFVVAQ